MRFLINVLRLHQLDDHQIDEENRLEIHQRILAKKPMLRDTFTLLHQQLHFLAQRYLSGKGPEIELGSGVSSMSHTYRTVLATDLLYAPHLDCILDAQCLGLADQSVRVFYGQNCFHHFSKPELFFKELERTLIPGGGAVLLEPYYGKMASILYKRLFHTEGFDKTAESWESAGNGPMNGANQALSYLVFVRDRKKFEQRYPQLEIIYQKPCSHYLKYLASGGLNFRPLWPQKFSLILSFLQKCLSPFDRWLALHHIIVIKKKSP